MSGGLEASYLNALPSALVAADKKLDITFLNHAAEILFETSAQHAIGQPVTSLIPLNENEREMIGRVFASSDEISLYEKMLKLTYGHHVRANLHITPVAKGTDEKVVEALFTIERSVGLQSATASEWKKETTRAAGIMAAMMAHEVKNPLSGIRGAAQLLKDELSSEHQPLAELICMETDRIRDLLAQVEIFSDAAPAMHAVNIHEVLQYVISVARAGIAKDIVIKENYDPSLPLVMGHRDLLVQMFLNLVKNAVEAMAGQADATVIISTTYRSGYRIKSPTGEVVALPIMVSIADNGPGIPDALRERLFEPFVSSKEDGRGLGLAVVAKLAADLGAVVELDMETAKGAKFNIMLPVE